MSDARQPPEGAADAETQRLHRAQPPLPGPLDPTRSRRRGEDGTEVMSLDQLMAGEEAPPADPAAAVTEPDTAEPAVAEPAARHRRSEAVDRVLADARAAATGALRRGAEWLRTDDNLLVGATLAIAVALLAIVAAL